MIVVIGSRHDTVAAALVDAWPNAALCSAEDLTRPGWVWRLNRSQSSRWVIGGEIVDDEDITGVFVRRSAIYPEEFLSTHPDDRTYLAAETQAFLIFVLAATRALVATPVADGALGDEAIRPERWILMARQAGVSVAPLRLTSNRLHRRQLHPVVVEVVGSEVFGNAPLQSKAAALKIVHQLNLLWAAVVFDGRHRLLTITSARPPCDEAVHALGCLLAGRAGA
jgi:hypothetical protein